MGYTVTYVIILFLYNCIILPSSNTPVLCTIRGTTLCVNLTKSFSNLKVKDSPLLPVNSSTWDNFLVPQGSVLF